MSVFRSVKNSREQGARGVAKAISHFTMLGYTVCIPVSECQRYDLIIDVPNEGLKRVEVKTTTSIRHGSFVVSLRTIGGNRSGTGKSKNISANDADLLFILTDDDIIYLIPVVDVDGTTALSLGKSYDKYISV